MSPVAYWSGKLVDELSREELIEALNQSVDSYNRLLLSNQAERKFWNDRLKTKTEWRFWFIRFVNRLLGREDESS